MSLQIAHNKFLSTVKSKRAKLLSSFSGKKELGELFPFKAKSKIINSVSRLPRRTDCNRFLVITKANIFKDIEIF